MGVEDAEDGRLYPISVWGGGEGKRDSHINAFCLQNTKTEVGF